MIRRTMIGRSFVCDLCLLLVALAALLVWRGAGARIAMDGRGADIIGGQGGPCVDYVTAACGAAPGGTCSTTPCTAGWFSWYCASGTLQGTQVATSYITCGPASSGFDSCYWNGDNPNWPVQLCWYTQACGTSCVESGVSGIYYCAGPVGPWTGSMGIYLPAGVGSCPDMISQVLPVVLGLAAAHDEVEPTFKINARTG